MKIKPLKKNSEFVAFVSDINLKDKKGIILPLKQGINLIGKGGEDSCLYIEREHVCGILEQSQVLIRMNKEGNWVTDATSTNQSKLILGSSAIAARRALQVDYLSCKKSIYFEQGKLPQGIVCEEILPIPWQSFSTPVSDRTWFPLNHGDLLCHFYGFMTFYRA